MYNYEQIVPLEKKDHLQEFAFYNLHPAHLYRKVSRAYAAYITFSFVTSATAGIYFGWDFANIYKTDSQSYADWLYYSLIGWVGHFIGGDYGLKKQSEYSSIITNTLVNASCITSFLFTLLIAIPQRYRQSRGEFYTIGYRYGWALRAALSVWLTIYDNLTQLTLPAAILLAAAGTSANYGLSESVPSINTRLRMIIVLGSMALNIIGAKKISQFVFNTRPVTKEEKEDTRKLYKKILTLKKEVASDTDSSNDEEAGSDASNGFNSDSNDGDSDLFSHSDNTFSSFYSDLLNDSVTTPAKLSSFDTTLPWVLQLINAITMTGLGHNTATSIEAFLMQHENLLPITTPTFISAVLLTTIFLLAKLLRQIPHISANSNLIILLGVVPAAILSFAIITPILLLEESTQRYTQGWLVFSAFFFFTVNFTQKCANGFIELKHCGLAPHWRTNIGKALLSVSLLLLTPLLLGNIATTEGLVEDFMNYAGWTQYALPAREISNFEEVASWLAASTIAIAAGAETVWVNFMPIINSVSFLTQFIVQTWGTEKQADSLKKYIKLNRFTNHLTHNTSPKQTSGTGQNQPSIREFIRKGMHCC